MHDLHDDANQINRRVVESPELLGKECLGCRRILEYSFYERDHSRRDGRGEFCDRCRAVPRMSIDEHTARLREMNAGSHALKRQQWQHQDEYRDEQARVGRTMTANDLIAKLRRLVPSLHVTAGGIAGDLAVYQTYGQPQSDLEGRSFRYLFYVPTGLLPEYSFIEFDKRDVPVKEKQRGWRTVLLRLIQSGLITEEDCNRVFGPAVGQASAAWHRQLHAFRNRAYR